MGERFQKFLNIFKKVKDGIKAEKKVSEAIKTIEPSLPLPSLFPPPIFTRTHAQMIEQYREHERRIMDKMFLTTATGKARERLMEMIGCPPGTDPVGHLRKRLPPDIPYGTPRWMSTVVGESQGTQDTTEKKEPTRSLSGPLEKIREKLGEKA